MINRRAALKAAMALPIFALADGGQFALGGVPVLGDYGVASGDPRPDGVILWTRIPEYAQPSDVTASLSCLYEVSTSAKFESGTIVLQGQQWTGKSADWCVKVPVTGLAPATTYYYRFSAGDRYRSVVGRTKTAPAENAANEELKFAFVSCQNFAGGYYTVFQQMVNEDLDVCVHLGDTIYEDDATSKLVKQIRVDPVAGGGVATTLEDYRAKYKLALSDPWFREVRRQFAWIHLWDDHEVFNNYTGEGILKPTPERRSVAYQAFFEYMPAIHQGDLSAPVAYRKLSYGSLADFFVLDERQFRSKLACFEKPKDKDAFVHPCPTVFEPQRTMLGAAQLSWIEEELKASTAKWKFVLNEVTMMQIKFVDTEETGGKHLDLLELVEGSKDIYFSFDSWDGYPVERAKLLDFIGKQGIKNVVMLTGDIHNCFAGVLKPDFEDPMCLPVAVEIVGGSVTSGGIGDVLRRDVSSTLGAQIHKHNSHMRYLELMHHVFVKINVKNEVLEADYIGVESTHVPSSKAVHLKKLKVYSDIAEIFT